VLKTLSAGFTLIELAIVLVILAFLLSLGMPAFTGVLESSRIKAAASGFGMGLQRARVEAISRNTTVWFVPESGVAGWVLSTVSDGSTPFESKPSAESSGNQVTVAIDPTTVTAVSFNSLGRATAGAPVNFNFSGPSGCSGEIRCLRVRVSAGGQVRVCDPAVTNTADTRSCGT